MQGRLSNLVNNSIQAFPKENWRDERLWNNNKIPFSPKYINDYTNILSSAFRRCLNKNFKILTVPKIKALLKEIYRK